MEDRDRDHGGGVSDTADGSAGRVERITRGSILALAVTLALGYAGWSLWKSRAASEEGQRLAALARPGDILMISSQTCAYCTIARRWLNTHQVAFKECFVETDALCAEAYRTTLAQGTPTLLVRGQVQLGFDPQRVLARLQSAS
jgi:glutaredoxin